MKINRIFLFHMMFFLTAWFFCSAARSQESAVPAAGKPDELQTPEEVSISAERMEMQMEGHTIELSGNVLVYDSTMNLTAEKMTVYLDKDNKLDRVEAVNSVTIRKLNGSESATGDRGCYDSRKDLITLEGNCTLLQGKNVLSCSEIIYDRKKQTITAKGASLNLKDLKNRGGGDFLKPKKDEDVPAAKLPAP